MVPFASALTLRRDLTYIPLLGNIASQKVRKGPVLMENIVRTMACARCPLQGMPGLRELDDEQIAYMEDFKTGEIEVDRGEILIEQGEKLDRLFTLTEGVLIRYRCLDDGRRQIVNFMFPGDLVGLQSAFDELSTNSVEALLKSRVCVFEQPRYEGLIAKYPRLGYDVTWLAAKEETALEEHLVALGRRSAKERVAYLAVWLVERAKEVGMAGEKNRLSLPIRQAQIADMLGLSLVHTNRTIKALDRDGLVIWQPSEIHVPDLEAASDFANFERRNENARPFI